MKCSMKFAMRPANACTVIRKMPLILWLVRLYDISNTEFVCSTSHLGP